MNNVDFVDEEMPGEAVYCIDNHKNDNILSKVVFVGSLSPFWVRQVVNHKGLTQVNTDASLFLFAVGDTAVDALHVIGVP